MTPERWRQVARIYELAADHDPAGREAFLRRACAADDLLRREVESLFHQDSAEMVLDRPVWSIAAPLLDDRPDLGPGALLGPYRIDSPLGAGGMGDVFRATDTRLDRAVAIKVLPTGVALDEQARARFAREARTIAALTHPHICTLYDVGNEGQVDFLVMECLEGRTLAARLAESSLSLEESVEYAIAVASALDHAHRHGVVHRDLKPANVMLTASGAKLLDFGLAKFRPAAPAEMPAGGASVRSAADTAEYSAPGALEYGEIPLTTGGAILGTVPYMSPEQVQAREVDARSDLFSFGAVVFEMLTGRRAFHGTTAADVRRAILGHYPPPVSSVRPHVPSALDTLVGRCLAKDPGERPQVCADVVGELQKVSESLALSRVRALPMVPSAKSRGRTFVLGLLLAGVTSLAAWLAAPGFSGLPAPTGPRHIRSLAVLPLDNLSGDPEEEYFADGMTEQLVVDLAAIGGLRVISRTSVMQYKEAQKPATTIARELQVDGIIEGSVARTADQVRITAKLIDGSTGAVIWAQSFERDLRDVLALQREVARTLAAKVDISLTPEEQARLSSARSVDPETHRQVLLGRHHSAKGTEEGLRKAVQYFNAALARDPANALGHAWLAEAYAELSGFYIDPREAMPMAKRAAQSALRLDEGLAEAHAALGYVHLVYDWDGPAAEKALTRALDLNPTLATARLNYSAYLTTQARHEDAVREIRRAVALDPLSIRTHSFGTVLLLFTRQYDEAVDLARRGLELEPRSAFTLAFQGVAYAEQGRFEEAVDNLRRAVQLDDSLTILALQAHVLAVAGRKSQAEAVIRRVREAAQHRYFCPYEIATVYVSLGDADTAYELFRQGTDERADCMAWLGVEPWIDAFRSDPRYARLLREVGLTPLAR